MERRSRHLAVQQNLKCELTDQKLQKPIGRPLLAKTTIGTFETIQNNFLPGRNRRALLIGGGLFDGYFDAKLSLQN